MRTLASPLVPLLGVLLAGAPARSEPVAPPPRVDEGTLLRTLRERALPLYEGFRGVEYQRTITLKESDPDSGELQHTKVFRVKLQELFYKAPEQEILSCQVDGKAAAPGDCKGRGQRQPMVPVFDKRGRKNYALKLKGTTLVNKIPCYLVQITPLKKSERHLGGVLWVDQTDLRPVGLQGTLSELPFPLKRFSILLYFTRHEGHSVVSRGELDITVKVPVFYSARLVSQFESTGYKLLPR